jgi:hypothetical protein
MFDAKFPVITPEILNTWREPPYLWNILLSQYIKSLTYCYYYGMFDAKLPVITPENLNTPLSLDYSHGCSSFLILSSGA